MPIPMTPCYHVGIDMPDQLNAKTHDHGEAVERYHDQGQKQLQ